MADSDEWMDAEAAARYINFHVKTIYRMVRAGQLLALRFPARIRQDDLDACLERCRIKPGEVSVAGEPPITQRGTPDRRFGPRAISGESTRLG